MSYNIICIILLPLLGTSLGALCVYIKKGQELKNSALINGFCAGVMTCSALVMAFPHIAKNLRGCFNCLTGLLAGALLIALMEYIENCFKKRKNFTGGNGLITAIILHNIPEGIAVGAAAGAVISKGNYDYFPAFAAMSVGIAIQNIPEGAIVSLPLLKKGYCKKTAFAAGFLSGVVEPLAAFVTVLLFSGLYGFSEYLTCCASGAMLYVCFFNLLPESVKENKKHTAISFVIGFFIMCLLDLML